MIQFGLQLTSRQYTLDDTNYTHFVVFLGLGPQFGIGELIVPDDKAGAIRDMATFIERQLMRYVYNGPERFWHFLHHLIPTNPEVIRAIDMASWDLWAKLNGNSVAKQLYIGSSEIVEEMPQFITIFDIANIFDSESVLVFDSTQGITDIKIHPEKYTLDGKKILIQNGSYISARLLSILCPHNDLHMNTKFLEKPYPYKDAEFDNGIIRLTADMAKGHGITLKR